MHGGLLYLAYIAIEKFPPDLVLVALYYRVILGSLAQWVSSDFPNYLHDQFSLVSLGTQELERKHTPPRLRRRYGMRVGWFRAGTCLTTVLFDCIYGLRARRPWPCRLIGLDAALGGAVHEGLDLDAERCLDAERR